MCQFYERRNMRLALRHFFRLFKDIIAYSWVNEVWWAVPLVMTLLAIGFMAVTAHMGTPYIYALF